MNKLFPLVWYALGASVLLLILFFPHERQKNVVIFAFDGLQARHLHAYGYEKETTPNLDAFLNDATVFRRTVAPASWTVPSFMSIFTSRYPSEHKLTNKLVEVRTATTTILRTANLQELAPGIETLSQIFKRHGYVTAGFTGDAGVKGAYGYSAGFDTYYDATAFGGLEGSVPRAITWLGTRDTTRPFFLFVHGYDVHGQHAPEGGFDYRYVTKPYTGLYTGSPKEQSVLREAGLRGNMPELSAEDQAFWRAIYDEKINRADAEFQVFIDALKEKGLFDNTIIIVLSDHGTEFFEHGRVDHGHTLYGELLDVLFAIHSPGEKPHVVTDLVSTIDLAPTLLSLAGIRDPAERSFQGVDLTPALLNTEVGHDVYSETDYRLFTHKRSVTTQDEWKFILTRETGEKELYNLIDDPTETRNLLTSEPRRAYELEQKLLAHLRDVGDTGPWRLGCLAVYADQCK